MNRPHAAVPLAIALAALLAGAGCLGAGGDGAYGAEGGEPATGPADGGGNGTAPTAPNAEQTGANGLCLDYHLFYQLPGVDSPLAATVAVAPGTAWRADSPDGVVAVDFYDDEGTWLDYGAGGGFVPPGAGTGIVCVLGAEGTPAPLAGWVYQDGL